MENINSNKKQETSKRKLIIDTDSSYDALISLIYLLNKSNIEIKMISFVEGSSNMNDVYLNINHIKRLVSSNAPGYKGAHSIMRGCPHLTQALMSEGVINKFSEDCNFFSEIEENSIFKIAKLIEENPN
jgi:inosine-uridine nucleoside N-ribohydrolase